MISTVAGLVESQTARFLLIEKNGITPLLDHNEGQSKTAQTEWVSLTRGLTTSFASSVFHLLTAPILE